MAAKGKQIPILRQKAAPVPAGPSDADLGRKRCAAAIERAAEASFGLAAQVGKCQIGPAAIEPIAESLGTEAVITLTSAGRASGCAILSVELVAALIELQTLGQVLERAAADAAPTNTDLCLVLPFVDAVLAQIGLSLPELGAVSAGLELGERIMVMRKLPQIFAESPLMAIEAELTLAATDRTGRMLLMLPEPKSDTPAAPMTGGTWSGDLARAVLGAQTHLRAVLHQLPMTLDAVEAMEIGDLVPLSGCTIADVRLVAADGLAVATGRLGQSAGQRAVRIEPAPERRMKEGITKAAKPVPQSLGAPETRPQDAAKDIKDPVQQVAKAV